LSINKITQKLWTGREIFARVGIGARNDRLYFGSDLLSPSRI